MAEQPRFFREWDKFSTSQRLSVMAAVLAPLGGIAAVLMSGVGNAPAYVSAFIAVMVMLVSDRLARFEFENSAASKLESIPFIRSDLKHIGGIAAGVAFLSENVTDARLILNTVYRPLGGEFAAASKAYGAQNDWAKRAIDDKAGWHDIVLGSAQLPAVRSFHQTLRADRRSAHEVYLAEPNVPLIQLTIIKYHTKKPSVVCVGWGFEGSDGAPVFTSSEPDVVAYFESYWKGLLKNARTVDADGQPSIATAT